MKVYVDSPLAVSATEIYRLHPESFNEDVYHSLFERQNPFGFEDLTLVRSVSGSKALNDIDGVAIIISASGMCEAGRILHHLKNNIGDPKTTVLFVGYCADNTLGRPIRDGEREVPILSKIPLPGFFFKQEGVVDENRSLMVLVRASVTDVKDLMEGR